MKVQMILSTNILRIIIIRIFKILIGIFILIQLKAFGLQLKEQYQPEIEI